MLRPWAGPCARSMVAILLVAITLPACSAAPTGPGGDAGDDDVSRTCLAPTADRANTSDLTDPLGHASVTVLDVTPCRRQYTLSSTATRRDNLPAGERVADEIEGQPTLRTGNDLFDAMYALALSEVREASVTSIHDGAFASGARQPCPLGGCFETGRLWTYVWTRDTAYAVDLGLAAIDPLRAKNSLEYKLSAPRDGGDEEIVQDTGTGGSYPVSTDRVVWALGADAVLAQLPDADRDAFRARAFAAIAATLERDRRVVYDETDGLYTGEQSFLDWREQSYPAWVAGDPSPIASSKALSTNILHMRAMEIASEMATALGQTARAAHYASWAAGLRTAIRTKFWLDDAGLFATFLTTQLDPAPARQFDLLGNALAVIAGVATEAQATRILASYPHMGPGAAPVIYPEQQQVRIYHNRAEWPFVTAYWLRAAAKGDNAAVAARAIKSLLRGAALNLSNMENFEIASGSPSVDDGALSGPVVNSQRQLWSIGGYVSMVDHTLFGVHVAARGMTVAPYVPRALRTALFGASDSLILNDLRWGDTTTTIVLHLPPVSTLTTGAYRVASMTLNGTTRTEVITRAQLDSTNRIDVQLEDPTGSTPDDLATRDLAKWHEVFAPRVPAITAVAKAGAAVALTLDVGGEVASTVTYSIYRDGTRVTTGIAGTETSYIDTTASAARAPCFAVETCFADSGNCSHRSKPACWWDDNSARIISIPASALIATGGTGSSDHGRFHYDAWGDVGDTLVAPSIQPTRSGAYLVQAVYGNGAGSVDTGVTCGVKYVEIVETATNVSVGSGMIVMPQLGTWDKWSDSTFVRAQLVAGKTYRVTVSASAASRNMSAFAHFQTYGGAGGAGGELSRVNISELKLLAR